MIDWTATYAEAGRMVDALGERFNVREEAGGLTVARRTMAEIAAAVASQPKVLFLDEPTASLTQKEIHNLFAQIEGRKRFVLFNPDQFEDLYPGPLNTRSESFSRVDLKRPDFKRFPRLADVEYWEAVVWPGDLLFMPAYWWHHVSSQDVSVSVNYWWRPDVRDALCPAFLRQLYLNLNLEDVNALFEAFDFSALGTGSTALLALAEMALDHSEPGAATRICGGITVASLRESLSLAEADVPSLVAALGPEHDPARRCITAALRARPGRPSPEAADLIAQLRASNLTFQTG